MDNINTQTNQTSANTEIYSQIDSGFFTTPTPTLHRITSKFGWRTDPIYKTRRFHRGVDIAGVNRSKTLGQPVYASAEGIIEKVIYKNTGYGNNVLIRHKKGATEYETRYCHLHTIEPIKVGDIVKKGQKIGAVGTTGKSTGPHLHFEIHVNGTKVDPLKYIKVK